MVTNFTIGSKFTWAGKAYIVARRLPGSQLEIVPLDGGPPQVVGHAVLAGQLAQGLLRPFPKETGSRKLDALADKPALADLPEQKRTEIDERADAIRPLQALSRRERTEAVVSARAQALRAAIQQGRYTTLPPDLSARTLYRWLKDLRASRGDPRSLACATGRRGGAEKRLGADVEGVIEAVARAKYLAGEAETIKAVHQVVAAEIAALNQGRPAGQQLPAPCYPTVARRIAALEREQVDTARLGARAARRLHRQVGQMNYPKRPLERVEIDHTRLDVLVVDDQDGTVLGRPTLTWCLDMATRYPLGYYVGFEPPSYYAVMECLYHAILPKPDTCQLYGTENQWDAYGLPESLAVDNAREFRGHDLEAACLQLGIQLEYSRVGTPEDKAGVERGLGARNTGLFHRLPGTTFSNPQARGDYDSAGRACLTLSALEQALVIHVVDQAAQDFHAGLRDIPARRWRAARDSGFFPDVPIDPDWLLIVLGRTQRRTVQHYGIELFGLRYNHSDLGPIRDHLRGAADPTVVVKYHPGDLSRVHILDPLRDLYLAVPATDQALTRGLSLWKRRVMLRAEAETRASVSAAAQGRAEQKIDALIAGAQAQARPARVSKARWKHAGEPPSAKRRGRAAPKPAPAAGALYLPPRSDPLPETGPAGADGEWEAVELP